MNYRKCSKVKNSLNSKMKDRTLTSLMSSLKQPKTSPICIINDPNPLPEQGD
ncbi:hypothetical protein HanXRQr2_Chr08g0321921 [Helianthus annuus]|uniref:Uncharacterized protein n=1 Tax=Helianthus annuus TaxID=4232 RepID=A0A9K3IBL9_HELAN|nr:hypothetical protein HanXRQr2_Chr08g0321921 [Helianthus annuus]KAJ0900264.1 hypothetical protein HanPSC8_Chr08g0311911 [Helianthus annuus]